MDHEDIDIISMGLAEIKVSHKISDRAMDAVCRLFTDNAERIMMLREDNLIGRGYFSFWKPRGLKKALPVTMNIVYREKTAPENETLRLTGLKTIPQKIVRDRAKIMLRSEAVVQFEAILEHHRLKHPDDPDVLRVSACIDGVRESYHSPRNFIMVMLKIQECIYPWVIHHPLLSTAFAKPTTRELLE